MPFISSIRKKHDNQNKGVLDHLDITGGDEIYTAGGYRIHVFTQTGDSQFSVMPKGQNVMHLLPNASGLDVEYLVLAGGASGGKGIAGGGGAGGYLEGNTTLGFSSSTPTTVGDGGPRQSGPNPQYRCGHPGGNSVFGPITATGGGGAGTHTTGAVKPSGYDGDGRTGGSGGSGGGGGGGGPNPYAGGGGGGAGGRGFRGPNPRHSGGAGTPGQGHPGGNGGSNPGNYGGPGGGGLASSITGQSVVRAGGGGGGNHSGTYGDGGSGGGTPGQMGGNAPSANAPNNSGAGSGGTGHSGGNGPSGKGGPGIVVVRYRI